MNKTIKSRLEELKNRSELLIHSLGKEKFESIVDEISTVITKNNIDKTPTILKDLMDYVVDTTLLEVDVHIHDSRFIPSTSDGICTGKKSCSSKRV